MSDIGEKLNEATDGEVDRSELEREADRVRARLLTTLDVLDRRRHDALDVRHQVEEHIVPVASIAAGAVVLVLGAIGAAVWRAIDRRHHKNRERIKALRRLWNDPEHAARYQPRSIFGEVIRKAALAAASMIAVELTKRAVHEVLTMQQQPHPESPRPLPPSVTVDEERLRPDVTLAEPTR